MTTSARQALRLQLIKNGYRPLPLLDKGIRIKGWVRDEIDEEWVTQFARQGRYKNTGLRCDDLIAFDIDVYDEALAEQIEKLIEDNTQPTTLCRFGQYPKRLLLYRVDGDLPEKSARTGKYGEHQVELLCGRGRQFCAFGLHPCGKDYEWDSVSPLDVAYADLPAVTCARALHVLGKIEQFFLDSGLEATRPGGQHGVAEAVEYDLKPDMPLLVDGAETVWGAVRETLTPAGVFADLQREDGAWGDSGGVHCFRAAGSDQPVAYDFPRDCLHREALGAEGLELPAPPEGAGGLFDPPAVTELLENWVLLGDKTVRHVDAPGPVFSLDGFCSLRSHEKVSGPKGAPVPATKVWRDDSRALRADLAALRPDYPDDAILVDGPMRLFNTYTPPDHPVVGGEIETVKDFVAHLVPGEAERTLFWDWHALKVAHPDWRMHGLVMVTPAYGTGRGTWKQILERLFGQMYVNEILLEDLTGKGSQAQYNELLASSLIISVPESLEEREDLSKWAARHLAYERLKGVCDPVAQRAHIRRKYGKNSEEWVFSSIMVSSNHRTDAVAIPPGDRRLIVLDNTEIPLYDAPDGLFDRIQEWKNVPENIGALQRWLLDRAASGEVAYDPFAKPPETAAKSRLTESGQSDFDKLFEHVAETLPGAVVTFSQWRAAANKARFSQDLDLPTGDRFDNALRVVMQQHGRRIDALVGKQLKVQRSVVRPWVIREFKKWVGCEETLYIREEILKNGPPGGQILELPQR